MKRDVNFGWAIFGIYVASWIIGLWLSSSFGAFAKAADEISSLASETSMRVQTFSAGVQESSSTIENVATQGRFVESEAEEDVRLVKETTEGIAAVDEATSVRCRRSQEI
jgi:methyl-accepting chemotaxis protein